MADLKAFDRLVESLGRFQNAIEKATSEWQTVEYRCMECEHTGECHCRIGEHAFCGKCGSEWLMKPKDVNDEHKYRRRGFYFAAEV